MGETHMFLTQLLDFLSGIFYLFLHVTGGGTFPKALSAQEEKKCLEEMARGSEAARRKLIEHNLRLVAHIIKKYYANQNDQEDLISIGTIGLIKAVDSFNAEKGIKLSSYASRCIEKPTLSQRNFLSQNRKKLSLWGQNGGSGVPQVRNVFFCIIGKETRFNTRLCMFIPSRFSALKK